MRVYTDAGPCLLYGHGSGKVQAGPEFAIIETELRIAGKAPPSGSINLVRCSMEVAIVNTGLEGA